MSKKLKRIKSLRITNKQKVKAITRESSDAFQSIFYLDLGDALELLSVDNKNLLANSNFVKQLADKYEVNFIMKMDPVAWCNHHMLIKAVKEDNILRFEQLIEKELLSISIHEALITAATLKRYKIIEKALNLKLPIHDSVYENFVMTRDIDSIISLLSVGLEPTDDVLCNLVKIRDIEILEIVSKWYKIPSPRVVTEAVEKGDIEIVEILVENDANFDLRHYILADLKGHDDIKDYLSKKLKNC